MRAACVLLVLAATATAEDLTPRSGSGWEGFGVGSRVKIKRTPVQEGRALTVTISVATLEKAGKETLTIKTVSENALGLKEENSATVPTQGEAGEGEKEKTEELEKEELLVAGKRMTCARTQTTVTGPNGRRVVTKWISDDPKAWVKRTEVDTDATGTVTRRSTWLLLDFDAKREIGEKTVRCLKYRMREVSGEFETTGDFFSSRDVPGSLVWMETETRKDGKLLVTQRVEVLDFEAK